MPIQPAIVSRSGFAPSGTPPGCRSMKLIIMIGGSTELSAAKVQVRTSSRSFASAGISARRAIGDVQDDRARLEQRQVAVLEHRHLAERLQGAVGGGLLVVEADQAHFVRQAGLLERPADAQVAHQALRERRHPAEGGDADHGCCPRRSAASTAGAAASGAGSRTVTRHSVRASSGSVRVAEWSSAALSQTTMSPTP